MAIHNQVERSMSGGMTKRVEASGMRMILDNLQKNQYNYPIRSTVRELVSNAIDSISEREVAISILSGEKKVEDYFVEIEGEEYTDSKFDPSYYDLSWLSSDHSVHLTYIVGGDLEKDKVIITDNGVGLGSYRLEKYFSLGYSTKRLSKLPLGKFGIGGKVALSIGVDYFTMESRYNGKKFRFNIYSHTIDSVIPEINLETGQYNSFILLNEGTEDEYKAFYEDTTEMNGVSITIEAKKNHKQQYIDAVKSQLLYFSTIDFIVRDEWGAQTIDYKASILYEDEHIVLSENSYYSKPHILLNKVNYGYINFEELELEEKGGNIGIKIAPEEVSVNPSRESIIWDDTTKQMVLNKFNTVVEIAEKIVQEELKQTDYLEWLRSCYSLTSKISSERTVIGRLSKIIDLANVKPSFIPEPKLKFQQTKVLNGLYVRSVKVVKKIVATRNRYSVERKETRSMNDIIFTPIILMHSAEKAKNKKDKYLFSLYPDGFVLVMEPLTSREGMLSTGMTEEHADLMLAYLNKEGEEYRNIVATTWEYLKSSQDIQWYEDIEIPNDFNGTDEEIDEEDTIETLNKIKQDAHVRDEEKRRKEMARIAQMSKLERRKLEGKTLIYTPRMRDYIADAKEKLDEQGNTVYEDRRIYDWQKLEIPIKKMNDWDAEEIYYSAGPDNDELVQFVAFITRDPYNGNIPGAPIRGNSILPEKSKRGNNQYSIAEWAEKNKYGLQTRMDYNYTIKDDNSLYYCQHYFGNKEILIVKTSAANARYMRDFQPIEQFFQQLRNNTLTMSNILIKWNTSRIIKEKLSQAAFLFNFDTFNPIYSQMYSQLTSYVDQNYREVCNYADNNYFGLNKATYQDLIKHLDNVQQFQTFVATKPTEKEVADMAMFMFGNKDIQDAQSVDSIMMDILSKVIDYVNSVGIMLNFMPVLTGYSKVPTNYDKGEDRVKTRIPMALEMEVKQYLEAKGMLDYGKDDEEIKQFQEELETLGQAPVEMPEEDVKIIGTLEQFEPYANRMGYTSKDVVKVLKADPTENRGLELPPNESILQEF